MTKVRGVVLILVTFVVLAGCSDFEALQKGVIDNNSKVETALSSYSQAKESSKGLETSFLEGIKSRDTDTVTNLEEINNNPKVMMGIEYGLNSFNESIYSYLNYINTPIENVVEGGEVIVTEEDISIDELIESSLNIHYFLDDETGKVEQLFLLQLPDGETSGLSVFWLGGVPFDYKTFGDI